MDNQQPITYSNPISYSKLNYTNIYLSYIIGAIALIILFKLYSNIMAKVNKHADMPPDFRSIIMGNSKDTLMDTVYKMLNLVLFEKLRPINYELDEYSNDVDNLRDKSENYKVKLIKTNANMIVDLQNTYISTKTTIENLKDSIKKTNEMHLANVASMNKIYHLYSNRINTYVNGLIKTMENLQYQINIAYITPTLTVVIDPIHKLYNSIYDTIMNNSGFIKKYVKKFDFNKVKPIQIKVDAAGPLNSNFEKSQEVLDKLGY